jgi:hypothetical protein
MVRLLLTASLVPASAKAIEKYLSLYCILIVGQEEVTLTILFSLLA